MSLHRDNIVNLKNKQTQEEKVYRVQKMDLNGNIVFRDTRLAGAAESKIQCNNDEVLEKMVKEGVLKINAKSLLNKYSVLS